jgi:hypothetical protein
MIETIKNIVNVPDLRFLWPLTFVWWHICSASS